MHRHWTNPDLAAVPLFASLDERQLSAVSRLTTRIDAPAGRVLIAQGAPGREFFVLIDGEAEVRRDGHLIATRTRGDHVGELALLDHTPRCATVIATTPVTLEVLGTRDFVDLMAGFPDVAARLVHAARTRRPSPPVHDDVLSHTAA